MVLNFRPQWENGWLQRKYFSIIEAIRLIVSNISRSYNFVTKIILFIHAYKSMIPETISLITKVIYSAYENEYYVEIYRD